LFGARTGGGGTYFNLSFQSANDLRIESNLETAYPLYKTNALFRDPSAWYHIVVALDMTQATSTERLKVYVNGVLQTTANYNVPAQNTDLAVNSTETHLIGQQASGSYLDGYLTEVNFIDGQALTPSDFGSYSASTGVWQPKKYAGTYGTNGFYLPFTNNASTTTLGNDFSGNGNNWTTNNISLTAGSTYDSMTDVPTLTSATASNFCTLNPIFDPNYFSATNQSNVAMSGGNLNYGSGGRNGFGTIAPSSGKYYWEMSNTSNTSSSVVVTGIVTIDARSSIYGIYYNSTNGNKGQGLMASGATETSYGSTWTDNDIIGVALDCDTNTVTFYKNNVSQGAITNSNIAGKQIVAWMQSGNNVNTMTGWFNFGQRPFAYTPPTGFVALNTFNLPTPTIGATASTQAGDYFNTVTYTGNGASSRAITGVGFQPDLVWTKSRSGANPNVWIDSNRGLTKYLISNSTAAEGTNATLITSFDSDGFTIGSDDLDYNNYSGDTYVAWNWRASNATAVSNTAGSITSTVSANTSAGFSVVTYTGNGTGGATIGHGLGVAPRVIILKRRNGTSNWTFGHSSLPSWDYYLVLNTTDAQGSNIVVWNNTAPTSSVFTVGTGADQNGSGNTIVAYCFSEVAGYSKFGSYTGNGSTDGPFVYLGFRPRYVMFKQTSASGNDWTVWDTARNLFNITNLVLYPNSSSVENAATGMDLVSNGIKLRDTGTSVNANGATYIYMAFAESPFKYANAR
jgi:hypothetical protein